MRDRLALKLVEAQVGKRARHVQMLHHVHHADVFGGVLANVYAMEWEEGRLTWYLDGQKLWGYEGPTPQKEMQILLGQYQLGGHPKFAGWLKPTPDDLPYPRDFEIDYVRVYARE